MIIKYTDLSDLNLALFETIRWKQITPKTCETKILLGHICICPWCCWYCWHLVALGMHKNHVNSEYFSKSNISPANLPNVRLTFFPQCCNCELVQDSATDLKSHHFGTQLLSNLSLDIQNPPVIYLVKIGVKGTLKSQTSGDIWGFNHRSSIGIYIDAYRSIILQLSASDPGIPKSCSVEQKNSPFLQGQGAVLGRSSQLVTG